jgi:hypothetical protein
MIIRRSALWLGLVFIFLFGVSGALAKGPIDMVTIVGPDWYGEIEVTQPDALEHLDIAAFVNFNAVVEAPSALEQGYLLTRYMHVDGEYQAFDRVLYFSNPRGGLGYVYYLGMVDAHGSYDGKWYRVSEKGEETLWDVLQASDVRRASESVDANIPSPNRASILKQYLWLFTLAGGLGAGWFFGRRRFSPSLPNKAA